MGHKGGHQHGGNHHHHGGNHHQGGNHHHGGDHHHGGQQHHGGGNHHHGGGNHHGGHHHHDDKEGYFLIVSQLNSLCLALDDNNRLVTSIKSRENRLWWRWEGGILRNKTGLVLDIEGSNMKPGARVLGYSFHGGSNQQWRMEGGNILSKTSGLALDILNNNVNPGATVSVWTKGHQSKNQMWTMENQ